MLVENLPFHRRLMHGCSSIDALARGALAGAKRRGGGPRLVEACRHPEAPERDVSLEQRAEAYFVGCDIPT